MDHHSTTSGGDWQFDVKRNAVRTAPLRFTHYVLWLGNWHAYIKRPTNSARLFRRGRWRNGRRRLPGRQVLDRPGELRVRAARLPGGRLPVGDAGDRAGRILGVRHEVLGRDAELVDLAFVGGEPVGDCDP